MRAGTISGTDFLAGNWNVDPRPRSSSHNFVARWENGLKVVDSNGDPVKIICAGTTDNRTVYVRVEGVGYIGGWQYPHRKMPFKALVGEINKGIIYRDQSDLPNGRRRA